MTERQSMRKLHLTDVSRSYDPIERQRDLQREIAARRGTVGQGEAAETLQELTQRVRMNVEAMHAELAEILDWLPWKEWKTYRMDLAAAPEEALKKELLFEVVDLMHFSNNIAVAIGASYADLMAAYEAKQQENRRRQREGY